MPDGGGGRTVAIILLGGGLFFLASLARAETFVKGLRHEIRDIKIVQGSNIFRTNLELELALINDKTTSLRFKRLNGNILYRNSVVTSFFVERNVTIAPRDTTILQIPITINNLQVLDTLLDILINKQQDVDLRIRAKLQVGGVTLPIDEIVRLRRQSMSS